MIIEEGTRVLLKADPEGGLPEQRGVVLGIDTNGTAIIQLDREFWDEDDCDGLREVDLDQIDGYAEAA